MKQLAKCHDSNVVYFCCSSLGYLYSQALGREYRTASDSFY